MRNFAGKTDIMMNITLPLNSIYEMLTSLSVSNKKWLADHLYEDIEQEESAKALKQKKELASTIETGWKEVNSAIDGKCKLKTADELLSELDSLNL